MDKKEIRKHLNLYYYAGGAIALGVGLEIGKAFPNDWTNFAAIIVSGVGLILMAIDMKYFKKFYEYSKEK